MSNSVATRITNFIQPRLNKRSVAFSLCLLLSGLFWLLTSLSREYVDDISIPVVYKGVPDDMLLMNEPIATVNAEVKGQGFDLMWYWLQFEKLNIQVNTNPSDLPSIQKNGRVLHYILTSDKSGRFATMRSEQLDVLSVSPDTLFLKFAPKFIKQVPIKLNAEIVFQKQFGMVTDPILVPDSVLLIGAKEDIDTILFVLTEPQVWNNVNESLTAEVRLQHDQNIPSLRLSRTNVQVELNVVEFTEGSAMVPLTVLADDPEFVKVFPHEVEVTYQVPLVDYDKVNAEQFQVSVVVNDESVRHSSLIVQMDRKPEAVTQVRINPSQVEFIIQK